MPHRDSISAYLREIIITDGVVIDFGCGGKPAKNYVSLGEKVRYFSYDKNPLSKANVTLDIEESPLPSNQPKADVAFCIEVLEHTKNPDIVIENIWRNMKDGATLYLSVPFLFPIHHTEDYWRFTDHGIRLLLEKNLFHVQEIIATEGSQGWIVKSIKM